MLVDSSTENPREYRFDRWFFDAATGDLADSKGSIRLEPQVAKLLAFFLANQGRVITRDELIATVWEKRVVSDDAINRAISILRQTVTPRHTHAYIETVRRRGYLAHFPPPTEPPTLASKGRRSWAGAGILIIALIALVLWIANRGVHEPPGEPPRTGGKPPVVAVLPFTASDQDGDGAFFASGVHDDLLTRLAQLQSLRVISRTSVLEYGGANQNVREIGRELGADTILEGNVQTIGDQIRINVQLVDTETDAHLWAQTYDRQLTSANLFDVQAQIARAVATAMYATLTPEDALQLAIPPTENLAAYRTYHEAMEIRDTRGFSDPAYLATLQRAVDLDPAFVRAWAEIVGVLSLQYFSEDGSGPVERVEEMIEHIRTLSPESADHLIAQAYYKYYVLRHYEEAHELVTRSHALGPSDLRHLELKSWIERRLGDMDARLETFRLAQALDPRRLRWTEHLVRNLVTAHRYDEAEQELEATQAVTYELEYWNATLALRSDSDFGRWAAELVRLQRKYGDARSLADMWSALVAKRDFRSAQALARSLPDDFDTVPSTPSFGLSPKDFREVVSDWLLHDRDQLAEQLAHLRPPLEKARTPDGGFPDSNQYLAWALLSAVEGDVDEAARAVTRWQRDAAVDLAERWVHRHLACRLLGMIEATSPAVECLRGAFADPSLAMPFIEPHLPYYDNIRDEPAFAALLSN